MTKALKKVMRRSCNYNRIDKSCRGRHAQILANFERGSLVFGLSFAVMVGICMIWAAVV